MANNALAVSLCTTMENMRIGRGVYLPVKSIKNIDVSVEIIRTSEYIYMLKISPIDFTVYGDEGLLFDRRYDRREREADQFILYMVNDILSSLKILKIDKVNGEFSIYERNPQNKLDLLFTAFVAEFKHQEDMVLGLNECCVCYTTTKTLTNCKHALCLECISKLPTEPHVDPEDNIRTSKRNCPLCRQHIKRLGYITDATPGPF
jgi:hypothetical protein